MDGTHGSGVLPANHADLVRAFYDTSGDLLHTSSCVTGFQVSQNVQKGSES